MKTMAWLVLSLSTLAYAGSADAHRRAPIADGHSGHRIERAWDLRGDRIDRRFDRVGIRRQALHDGRR